MYKLLLCWRYLLTRYLALVCIISVMLGVATLIVVNSVMSGFSTKLRERLHGMLSDVGMNSNGVEEGFPNPGEVMARIRRDPFLNDQIVAMTPTMETVGMLRYSYMGRSFSKLVRVIGIDPKGRTAVCRFKEFLCSERNRENPSFELSPEAQARQSLLHPSMPQFNLNKAPKVGLDDKPDPDPPPEEEFVPEGIILGIAMTYWRDPKTGEEDYFLLPGDDVHLAIPTVTDNGPGEPPTYGAAKTRMVVCDYSKTEMSEYDSNIVFVSLKYLQQLRTMDDRATSIQMRLKDYSQAKNVTDKLKEIFPASYFQVQTWEEMQGPLLSAIAVEKGILNVLLFMIIGVAGFGILAIFSMIVIEKTRDIGILKALGASNAGVMKIFLGYGLLLGLIGAGLGTGLGLTITDQINPIEKLITRVSGHDIFPRDVYYFKDIPTDIQAWSVLLVNVGAIVIAVVFSILPALRAAMLHPVRALRYE
ncbi:MAG: ABC transporter permease [Gemmataceae bacterium]